MPPPETSETFVVGVLPPSSIPEGRRMDTGLVHMGVDLLVHMGVDLAGTPDHTVLSLVFRNTREAVEVYELIRSDPNVQSVEGRESAEVPDQFHMNVTLRPGAEFPSQEQLTDIVLDHLAPTAPLPPRREPEPPEPPRPRYGQGYRLPRPTIPQRAIQARRVTMPLFEIVSNPTIQMSDIRSRRFDLLERSEPNFVVAKFLPRVPTRYERLLSEDFLAEPA